MCTDSVCAEVVPPAIGDECRFDDQCGDDLICSDDACARPLAKGLRCERNKQCEGFPETSGCADDTKKCTFVGEDVPLNGRCFTFKNCDNPNNDVGCYRDDEAGFDTCQLNRDVFGARCRADDQCFEGEICANRFCQKLGDEGQTCSEDRECLAPLNCREGVCASIFELGESCEGN